MALRTSYDDTNKVVQQGRVVQYSSVPSFKDNKNSGHTPVYWKITRKSTMTYSYVGMTKATAESCAKTLLHDYTRMYMRWTANVTEVNGQPTVFINEDRNFECTSSIQPVHVDGDAWSVTVSANETDQIIALEEITDTATLESLFQSAEQRDYPSDNGSIAVVSAKWDSSAERLYVEYNAVINGYDRTKVGVETYENVGEYYDWVPVEHVFHDSDTKLFFVAYENKKFRLTYNGGEPRSNEWTTRNYDLPKLILDDAYFKVYKYGLNTIADMPNIMYTSYYAIVHLEGVDAGFTNTTNLKFYVYPYGSPSGKVVNLHTATAIGDGRYLLESKAVTGTDCDCVGLRKNIAISWVWEVTSSQKEVRVFDETVVIKSLEQVGRDWQHDTSSAYAFKFTALFTTTLPDSDALAAEVRMMTTRIDFSAAMTGSTVCTKLANGTFKITWLYAVDKKDTYDHGDFYLRINSSGKSYDSQFVAKTTDLPSIDITNISNSPALTIEFSHRLGDEFDISNLKVYRFIGNSAPTSLNDPYVETSYQLSNGKLLIVDGISGIFQLRYLTSSSNEVIGPDVNAILFRGFTEVGDGTYIAEYERQSDAWTSQSVYLCKNGELTVSYDTSLFPTIKFTPDDEADFYFIEYYAGQTRFYSRALAIED